MAKKKRREPKYKQEKKNHALPIIIILVLMVFSGLMIMKSGDLRKEKAMLKQEIADLQQDITLEENRTTQLKEYEVYTHTKAFAEEMASSKLGFVHEGEIIFRLNE